MRIFNEEGRPIESMADWEHRAGPKRDDQWKSGRSAFELAHAWIGTGKPRMPDELRVLLDSRPETCGLLVETVTPEKQIRFDQHGGEPRNADLAFVARTATNLKIAVTIEAKADEPFGATVAQTAADALERLTAKPSSQGVERVSDLVRSILPRRRKQEKQVPPEPQIPKAGDLRYQLLTGTAGTLAYAHQNGASVAVFLIHEFMTSETRAAKHTKNALDYYAFLHRLTGVPPGERDTTPSLKWFTVPGAPLFAEGSRLLIGKLVTDRRG